MRIKVEIGDSSEEFTYDRKGIYLGSDKRCQLFLNYEEIGAKHLKIVKQNNKTYIQDLTSGFQTIYNGKILAPGSVVEFQTFFPLEVGGILIYLLDEELESVSNFEKESLVENLIDSTNDINGKNLTTKDNPYKKDLFAEVKNTLNTEKTNKFELKQEHLSDKSSSRKINTSVRRVNKKTKKSSRKQKKSKLNNAANIRAFGIVSIGLFIISFIYYHNNYKPQLELVRKKESIPEKLELELLNENLNRNKLGYENAIKNETCKLSQYLSICNELKNKFGDISLGAINGNIYIGLDKLKLESFLDNLPLMSELEKKETLKDVEALKGVDKAEYIANNYISPLTSDSIKVANSLDLLSITRLVQKVSFSPFSNTSVQYIHFFITNSFDGKIEISNFLEVTPEVIELKSINPDVEEFDLKKIVRSNLASNIKDYISSYGKTLDFQFDNEKLNKYLKSKKIRSLKDIFTNKPCVSEIELSFCNRFSEDYFSIEDVGAYYRDTQLFLYFDLSKLNLAFERLGVDELTPQDKKILSIVFRGMNNSDQNFNDFFNSNYVAEITNKAFSKNLLMGEFVRGDYLDSFAEYKKDISKIFLVGKNLVDNSSDLFVVELDKKILINNNWVRNHKNHLKFISRNKLDIFYDVNVDSY